ncbi:hypothetical protein MNBD_GAMMA26-305 [hydrothermal vent metagenome]|uniref:histidine kinase n=1 Tax=hydrothermal vent metagenome TaxID=652676 RepID=A0A3B1BY10_9ZZZZ
MLSVMRLSVLNTPFVKALALGVAYYLSVTVVTGLFVPEAKITVFWFANSFAAVALLFSNRKHWPLYLSVMAVAFFSSIIPTGYFPLHVYLGLCAANIIEVLALVFIVRAYAGPFPAKDNLTKSITAVMLGAMPATFASTVIGTAFVYSALPEMVVLDVAVLWFAGHLVGLVLVLPALLVWLTPVVLARSPLRRMDIFEGVGIIAAITVVGTYFLTNLNADLYLRHTSPLLLFPLLIWSAIRLELRITVTAVFCIGLFVIVLAYQGYCPFSIEGISIIAAAALMHGSLIIIIFAAIFLAIVVTERSQVELALADSEARFRSLFESANVMIWGTYEDGMICVFNEEAERVLGYTKEEALELENLELHPPEERDEAVEKFAAHRDGIEDNDLEFGLYTKDGRRLIGNASQGSFKDSSGRMFYFVMVKDVTFNKQAAMRVAAEKKKYEDAIEGIQAGLVLLDPATNIVWANGVFQQWFGSFNGLEGQKCCDVYGMENQEKECVALHVRASGEVEIGEYGTVTVDGVQRCFQITVSPVFDEHENLVQLVELVQEISARKQDEDRIAASLKEKEILLREVHHRVKNNLQVISSLLSMQARRTNNHMAREALEKSQQRVLAMAMAHEQLHSTDDLGSISLPKYLSGIARSVWQNFSGFQQRVKLEVQVADIPVDMECAIPIGLITCELVTNALKYAFPDERTGTLSISVRKLDSDQILLEVSDNGVGIPDELDWHKTDTFGLVLVNSLVLQRDGMIELDLSKGTCWRITF